jgi:hypothetical protein
MVGGIIVGDTLGAVSDPFSSDGVLDIGAALHPIARKTNIME